jgi:hypothetical protein
MNIDTRRYPVGRYSPPEEITTSHLEQWIATLEAFPAKVEALTGRLSEVQLEAQYRDGGWTVRQVVHHIVDSHVNSYVRFKWTLTEDNPVIKTYDQAAWGELPDTMSSPVTDSLEFLSGLHARWVYLLRSMSEKQWKRTFYHPEYQKEFDLKWLLGLYDWHCRHHLAHIQLALNSTS